MAISYTQAAAEELLPSGMTRLHRAIFRRDMPAILAWVEAGADLWALHRNLPQTLRDRHWNPSVVAAPRQLSALALVALFATPETWPALSPLFSEKVLALAAEFPALPARVVDLLGCVMKNRVLSEIMMATLVERGLQLPALGHSARDVFIQMTSEERKIWIEQRGWDQLSNQLPDWLDHCFRSDRTSVRPTEIIQWLAADLPLKNPQLALKAWVGGWSTSSMPMAIFDIGMDHLIARGARLDAYDDQSNLKWSPLACSLLAGNPERYESILRRLGRTPLDEAGEPGSETVVAEMVRHSVNGEHHTYQECLNHAMTPFKLVLDATGPTATGVRSVLTTLPDACEYTDPARAFVVQTERWRDWATDVGLPDRGMEAGQSVSAFAIWWETLCRGAAVDSKLFPTAGTLVCQLEAWAGYAEVDLTAFIQGELQRHIEENSPIFNLLVSVFAPLGGNPWALDEAGAPLWQRMKQSDRMAWYDAALPYDAAGPARGYMGDLDSLMIAFTKRYSGASKPVDLRDWLTLRPLPMGAPVSLLGIMIEAIDPTWQPHSGQSQVDYLNTGVERLIAIDHALIKSEPWPELMSHLRQARLAQAPAGPSRRSRPRG